MNSQLAKTRFRKVFLEMVERRKLQQRIESDDTPPLESSDNPTREIDMQCHKRHLHIHPGMIKHTNNRINDIIDYGGSKTPIIVTSNVFLSSCALYSLFEKRMLLFWDQTSSIRKTIQSNCESQSFSLFMIWKHVSEQSSYIKKDLFVHKAKSSHIFSLTREQDKLSIALNGMVYRGSMSEHPFRWNEDGQYLTIVNVNHNIMTNEHEVHFELVAFETREKHTSSIKRFKTGYNLNSITFDNSVVSLGNNSFFVGETRYYVGRISHDHRQHIKEHMLHELLK